MSVYILSMEITGSNESVVIGAYTTVDKMYAEARAHRNNHAKLDPKYFYDVQTMDGEAAWTNQQMKLSMMSQHQQYTHWIMKLMQGDTHHIHNMLIQLREDGMIDKNDEEIFGQNDE